MRATALILLALALQAAPLAAADESVSLTVTPPGGEIRLADEFSFKIQVSLPGAFTLRPDTATASNSEFELVSVTRTAGEKKDDRKKEVYEVRAKAFTLGTSTFPAIAWELRGEGVPDGTVVKTSTFTIEVMPIFETKEGEGIRDIYKPYAYFPWLWLLLLAAAIALAVWLYLRRRRQGSTLAAAAWTDPRDPYQRARDRLDKLQHAPLAAAGKIKEYYTGLTAILRFYLAEEFAIDAAQMTTADLGRELKSTGAGIKTALKAREFLQKSDLVKFAKLKPEDASGDSEELSEILAEFNHAVENAAALAAEKAAAEAAAKRRGGAK